MLSSSRVIEPLNNKIIEQKMTTSNQTLNANNNNTWNTLRKEAKTLENTLDSLLVNLSSKAASYNNNNNGGGSGKVVENLDDQVIELQGNIEISLGKLLKTIENMADIIESNSNSNDNSNGNKVVIGSSSVVGTGAANLLHMLQRHRDILFDYNQEFKRIKQNLQMKKEQSELLSYVKHDISAYKESQGLSDTEILLNERSHLDNSHSLADSILQNAYDTRSQLQQQRGTMIGTNRRTGLISGRFSGINSLIRKIHLKKRKDTIIIALVTAICISAILIYKFS